MQELLGQLQNELVVSLTLVIVQLIKDLPFLQKIKTKFLSVGVALLLVFLMNQLSLSEQGYLNLEVALTVILPSLGFDYLIKPFYDTLIKPLMDLFKKG